MLKILIADGNEVTNLGLSIFLGQKFQVANARTNAQMFEMIAEDEYDIILLDYGSTNFSFTYIKDLVKQCDRSKIVAISSNQLASTMAKAIQLGVYSHLKKTCGFEEIVECLESTKNGEHFICGEILLDFEQQSIEMSKLLNNQQINCSGIKISIREIEIIKLIAEGNSAKQIAKQLYLSNHTINTHRKNIFNKLNINSTTDLVIYAVKSGIVNVDHFQFSN